MDEAELPAPLEEEFPVDEPERLPTAEFRERPFVQEKLSTQSRTAPARKPRSMDLLPVFTLMRLKRVMNKDFTLTPFSRFKPLNYN